MRKAANIELMLPEVPHEPASELLKTLGTRVRDARARHGMTRRMLARDSRISERYLAELESGRGNLSILLLKRLAAAIDVPLIELVDERPRPSAEYYAQSRIPHPAPSG